MRNGWRLYILTFLSGAIALAIALFIASGRIPEFNSIKQNYTSSDRAVLDRNGYVIDEVRVEKKFRRLAWVELKNVPRVFQDTLITAEDKRFFSHPGVDPLAAAKALIRRLGGHFDRGASTITMQLVTLILQQKKNVHRSAFEKLQQAWYALALELRFSKRQILEAYINLVHYRGELQGLSAASFGLFDKDPMGLTRPESAILASLIRAPEARVERVRDRACQLLTQMHAATECATLGAEHLSQIESGYEIRPYQRLAPFVGRMLKDSIVVHSTLDRQVQWVALHALQKQISSLQSQNLNDGAVVVIENQTGNILAYVGNIGAGSDASQVDAARAARQAGSALKPFLYGKAIDQRLITAATVLDDSPLGISVATGTYRPANFDRAFREFVTVRAALASSLNIPAVRTLEILGVDTMVDTLKDFGITDLQRPDFYGPSLALGSADVKLIEMTNAYRALANGGVWTPVQFSLDHRDSTAERRVISEQAAFIVKDILSDRDARAGTFGFENVLGTRFWTAVKTGTSKDMRDNWCLGFSERYTVGVWAGNFSGEPMWNVSGVQGAAPVWQEVMAYLHQSTSGKDSSVAPTPPNGLVDMKVTFAHSKLTRKEWFIAGTEPSQPLIKAEKEVQSLISYPLDQSLVAVDPDIPSRNNRIFIQVEAAKLGQRIYVNNQLVGPARDYLPWTPHLGKFRVELRDQRGLVVDKVVFEVRGRHYASR